MIWVIDCSFAAALFLPDENSENVNDFFLSLLPDDEVHVPALWWYEVANVLAVAERRKRLGYADIAKCITLFEKMNLKTDHLSGAGYAKEIYELAQKNKLSAYDAAYLELTIRKKANLASLDKDLVNAALHSGIHTFEI